MMHPAVASALAEEHRRDMTAQARQATLARQITQATRRRREPTAQRAHLRGALFPRYRVSWSRATLAPSAAPDGRGGRSWIIVISATRSL